MPEKTSLILQEIAQNNVSGSVALLSKAAGLFEEFLAEQAKERITYDASLDKLWRLCGQLLRSQPAMAALFQMVNRALWAAEQEGPPKDKLSSACRAVSAFAEEVSGRQCRVAKVFLSLTLNTNTILTHSSSTTVKEAILALKRSERDFHLILTESRPMLEGASLAKFFAARGVRCSLVADCMAFSLLPEVDCVIVGGDALTETGLFNKAGTFGLAIAAAELGRPFWALVGTEKFLPNGVTLSIPDKPAGEVLPDEVPGLHVLNRYFDVTPIEYLTGVVTELGPMDGTALKKNLEQMDCHPMLPVLLKP